jgi:ParB-like chromosome segregation protein Spo0J
MVSPASLVSNPWNTNRLSPEAELKLENSLTRLGMFKPVLVRTLENGTRQILGGEHRARAAQRLGWAEIPVIDAGEIDDQRAKEIGLIDNGRYGQDDAGALAALLESLGTPADIASFMPFDLGEIDALSAVNKLDLDKIGLDDEDADAIEKTIRAPKTHVVMRFKVPLDDQSMVAGALKLIIEQQGLDDSDSLINAGDALVYLVRAQLESFG